MHEVYPGHYTQFLWIARAPTKVRKLLGCSSNAEGWAHYTEQMMLDEGYGKGDLKLRLGQLQDALLRNARFIAGIQMHTGKMTVEEAVEFFVKEGYQVRPVAEKEAKRGTSDPTYLVYTLGKLEILKLREDYKKMKGGAYTLQGFHDAFLQQGYPPVKIVRRALLGNDSPVLMKRSDAIQHDRGGRIGQNRADGGSGDHVAEEVHAEQNPGRGDADRRRRAGPRSRSG